MEKERKRRCCCACWSVWEHSVPTVHYVIGLQIEEWERVVKPYGNALAYICIYN